MKNNVTESELLEFLNGELAPDEERHIREWIAAGEGNRKLFDEVRDEYLHTRWSVRAPLIKGDYSAFSRNLTVRKKVPFGKIASIAAAIAIIAVSSFLLLTRNPSDHDRMISEVGFPKNRVLLELSDGTRHTIDNDTAEYTERDGTKVAVKNGEVLYDNGQNAEKGTVHNKIIVPRGANPYKLLLDDGSTVWLNADSKLEYPLSFAGDERRVVLTGEACFDVAKNEKMPFIVESSGLSIAVLGTEFNVSGYPGETVVATLISGKVEVKADGNDKTITLVPGQQAAFEPDSGNLTMTEADTTGSVMWIDGTLNADKMPLDEVLKKVSRKYDVKFDVSECNIDDIILEGSISAENSFETVLSILNKTANVEFKPKKNGEIKVIEKL